jgi:protocatechuate 3,4-dioxygenase beta subunit
MSRTSWKRDELMGKAWGNARLGLAIAWLAMTGFAWAQAPPAPYASISGVVLNDAAGTPIRRAVVTLSTLDTPPLEAVTFTESNGVFGFTAIPPGKYRLQANMDGFQHAWFGASTPARPPGTLNLAAGDGRYGITFRLRQLGSISGVVLDPDGDPVPDASIRLLRAGFARRKPTYRSFHGATTDRLGRYRVTDVLPGQYVIMAVPTHEPAGLMQPEVALGQSNPQKMYAVDLYPDTSRLSAASPLPMVPGKDLDGIDFHLTARTVASLHGRLTVADAAVSNQPAQISVSPQDVPNGRYAGAFATAFPPDFTFEFPYLIPGPYMIVATFAAPGREYRGEERIELPPAGQEITLQMDRGIDLAGRVDIEGAGDRPAGSLRVTLSPGDESPAVGPRPTAEVKPDGAFTIPNVFPGIWDINVGPVPRGGYIKAMLLGDQDVLTEDMTITSNTREALRIVLSTRGGNVAGTVTVPQGVPKSARAKVLLVPSGKYEHVLSYYAVTAADDAGHFEFKSVTPGRYKLYAFEELEPDAYGDPGFLKLFEKLSEVFDVPEGGHLSREVPLIQAGMPAAEN